MAEAATHSIDPSGLYRITLFSASFVVVIGDETVAEVFPFAFPLVFWEEGSWEDRGEDFFWDLGFGAELRCVWEGEAVFKSETSAISAAGGGAGVRQK